MFRDIIEIFRRPSAEVLAQRELEDAKRAHLEALSATEYANRMSAYHSDRIKRLRAYLQQEAA